MAGSQLATISKGIQEMAPQFEAALPSHIPVKKFERAVLTAIQTNPSVMDANRKSLYTSCLKAAADGLVLDGREAALVMFKDQAQYMPMVAGLMKKARNSGEISAIHEPVIVYENDDFTLEYGDYPKLTHKPLLKGDRGKMIGAYSVIHLKDGSIQRVWMSREDIDKRKNASRSKGGPWASWPEEMAKKTVLKANLKYCPQSTDLEQLMSYDNELDAEDDKPARKTRKKSEPIDITPEDSPADDEPDLPASLDKRGKQDEVIDVDPADIIEADETDEDVI